MVTYLLKRNKCTYDEVDWILEQLQYWIKERRECNEYATYSDYLSGNKTSCMDNIVITPMGCVDDNLNPILKDGTPFI